MVYRFLLFFVAFIIGITDTASFAIKDEELKDVRLDAPLAKRIPTFKWSTVIDEIVPSEPYRLTIDPKDITGQNLDYISFFLKVLSKKPTVSCQEVSIINGTSFKFNRLISGAEQLFGHPTVRTFSYTHSGKANPATPSKVFQRLASPAENILLKRDGNLFVLTKEPPFDDDAASVASSVEKLGSCIREQEDDDKKQKLVNQWNEQEYDPSFCFPEKISPDGFLECHIEELQRHRDQESFNDHPYLYVALSGVSGEDTLQIVEMCRKNTHIRYVSIVDSSVSIEDLKPLFSLLEGGSLRLIDVCSALQYEKAADSYKNLEEFLEKNNKQNLLARFIWLPWERAEVVFSNLDLSEGIKKNHREFWLVDRAINLFTSKK